MANTLPSMDLWLEEAKRDPQAHLCGMYLAHNGVCRATPKAEAREGRQGLGRVVAMDFSYDAEGVSAAAAEARTWPGVHYVRVWLNEGRLHVGDSIMFVLIGADIRPRCVSALERLVDIIKNELVSEVEVYESEEREGKECEGKECEA